MNHALVMVIGSVEMNFVEGLELRKLLPIERVDGELKARFADALLKMEREDRAKLG